MWLSAGVCCLTAAAVASPPPPQFWDVRQPSLAGSLQLPERCYCMDVMYPMAVVGTASRGLVVYTLENSPSEFKVRGSYWSWLHHSRPTVLTQVMLGSILACGVWHRSLACVHALTTAELGGAVRDANFVCSEQKIDSPLKYQHRCVSIFKDKQNQPTGFALGSIEGRVAIHYINPPNP